MSILLAIIAFQLNNISGNLAPTGKLDADRRVCIEYTAKNRLVMSIAEEYTFRKSIADKLGIKAGIEARGLGGPGNVDKFCSYLI